MDLKYENLLGKEWEINKQDCFTLARDFYIQNFDIEVPDFARPLHWNADRYDLIRKGFPKCGFKVTHEDWDDLRPGDVLAMGIITSNADHLAVYVGESEVIHHRFGRTSCKELLRPFWRMATLYVLRHPDVPDLRPKLPDITIEEVLRARFTQQAT
jgi:cell wall-associated NlpC family hydrolase